MNTNKFAINWQNFARVRLQLKFAFIIRFLVSFQLVHTAKNIVFTFQIKISEDCLLLVSERQNNFQRLTTY